MLLQYGLVLLTVLVASPSPGSTDAEHAEEYRAFEAERTRAIDITDAKLDQLYRVMMEKVAGDSDDPLASWGIPAGGDYLDPKILRAPYWNKAVTQLTYYHFSYYRKVLDRLAETGTFEPGEDFYDVLLSRMADANLWWQLRNVLEPAGVSTETMAQYELAEGRYFDLVEAESLVRHNFEFSDEEKRSLIETAEKRQADSRRLFHSTMRAVVSELAGNTEARKDFTDLLKKDIDDAADKMYEYIKGELELLGSMRNAVAEKEPYAADFETCSKKEYEVELVKSEFGKMLFSYANIHGISALRYHPVFWDLILSMEEMDACVLDLFYKYRDDERSLLLINSSLSFGESWARSKKRIHYGDDLLFIEEIILHAQTYGVAFTSPPMGFPKDVYLNGGVVNFTPIDEGISKLIELRKQVIALKDGKGQEAPADKLFEGYPPIEENVDPGFGYWLTYDVERTPELRFGKVKDAALNRMQLGRIYMRRDEHETAHKHLLAAVTLAPSHWEAWELYADNAGRLKKRMESAQAYRRAVGLIDRCNSGPFPECEDAPQSGDDYGELLYAAGHAQLRIGDYARAAELFARAVPLVPEDHHRWAVEWLAVARFGSSDLDTAWDEYRNLFKGAPLPSFYEGGRTEKEFRRQKEPPAAFLKMLRAGFVDLKNDSYNEGRIFNEYLHTQNTARVEFLTDKHGRTHQETREFLLQIFVELTNWGTDSRSGDAVYIVSPDLSEYALAMARKAEKAVDKRKYIEAERYYKAALATDPWWLDGLENLAQLQIINWGHCGPGSTLDWMKQVLKSSSPPDGVFSPVLYAHRQRVEGMETKLRELFEEAGRSGSGNIIGLCDYPGAVYIQPDKKIPPE